METCKMYNQERWLYIQLFQTTTAERKKKDTISKTMKNT